MRNLSRLTTPSPTQFSIPAIDSCNGKGPGLFYLRQLRRYVRCTAAGELLVLYREKNNVRFNRSFAEYRHGFGDARKGDYWLGLDFLAKYTSQGDICARIQVTPWRLKLKEPSVQYANFEVGSEAKKYKLWYTSSKTKGELIFVNRKN